MYCPILKTECGKAECAWWVSHTEECCLKTIALNMETVGELTTGYRTMFVRSV